MAALRCVMCDAFTKLVCAVCKSANYCSTKCQDLDARLHILLCTRLEQFKAANPRPADGFLTTYTLGILFPETKDIPELVWVKHQLRFRDNSWMFGCDLSDYSEQFDMYEAVTRDVYDSEAGLEGLELWPSHLEGISGDARNSCFTHLLRGCTALDGDLSPFCLDLQWGGGTCIAARFALTDTEVGIEYRDVSLGDLRRALDSFYKDWKDEKNSPRALESTDISDNSFVVLRKAEWVREIIISCDSEVSVMRMRFRSLQVRKHDALFRCDDGVAAGIPFEICSIAEKMGFPIILQPLPIPEYIYGGDRTGLQKNQMATILSIGVDPSKDTWNTTRDLGLEGINGTPAVLVVRKDQLDITRYHVEVLSQYCSDVVRVAMTEDDGETHDQDIRKAIVEAYLTYEAFCKFFHQYKAKRVEEGQADWANSFPPPRSLYDKVGKRVSEGHGLRSP